MTDPETGFDEAPDERYRRGDLGPDDEVAEGPYDRTRHSTASPTVGLVGLRTWDYAFCSGFFFGCRETVVSLLRCPYTVERGTPNRSAICWTVLTRAS